MKRLILCYIGLILVACSEPPESIAPSSNYNFAIEKLFDYEDCTMYRFEDAGRDHYFAKCSANTTTIGTYSQSCGKNCVTSVDENIVTRNGGR